MRRLMKDRIFCCRSVKGSAMGFSLLCLNPTERPRTWSSFQPARGALDSPGAACDLEREFDPPPRPAPARGAACAQAGRPLPAGAEVRGGEVPAGLVTRGRLRGA